MIKRPAAQGAAGPISSRRGRSSPAAGSRGDGRPRPGLPAPLTAPRVPATRCAAGAAHRPGRDVRGRRSSAMFANVCAHGAFAGAASRAERGRSRAARGAGGVPDGGRPRHLRGAPVRYGRLDSVPRGLVISSRSQGSRPCAIFSHSRRFPWQQRPDPVHVSMGPCRVGTDPSGQRCAGDRRSEATRVEPLVRRQTAQRVVAVDPRQAMAGGERADGPTPVNTGASAVRTGTRRTSRLCEADRRPGTEC
jgi:hypothetical protein